MWWHFSPFHFLGFGMLGQAIFWIVIVFVVVKFFEKRDKTDKIVNDKALNILKERFAKGEINEEEYLRKKELLEK